VVVLTYHDSVVGGTKSFTNQFRVPLAFEDFESVVLGPNVDEGLAGEKVWASTPPVGWSVDNSQMPIGWDDPAIGVTEWKGWTFANKNWWITAAGDQTRVQFVKGIGTVAIADPDEWDDKGNPDGTIGYFNSYLISPPLDLSGAAAGTAFLRFDSSWRPEAMDDAGPDGQATNNQTALITIAFDGGAATPILKWDSVSGSPTYKPDSQNETVTVPIQNPAGAKSAVVKLGLLNAGNDWWWSIDNILLDAGATPPVISQQPTSVVVTSGEAAKLQVVPGGTGPFTYQWYRVQAGSRVAIAGATTAEYSLSAATLADNGVYGVDVKNATGTTPSSNARLTVLPGSTATRHFFEDFEGLTLGPSVDEGVFGEQVWTKTAPPGWAIDDSGVPGAGDPAQDGVTEWAGWSFAQREWWAQTAGDQRRTEFTKGTNIVAIADSDEYDDLSHPAGSFNTYLSTPAISLTGVPAGGAMLVFNSSWRPEPNQKANITAKFDGGTAVEVLRFESDTASPYFKDDASTSDVLVVPLNNPAGAGNVVLTFGYFDSANNWWWAIDNVGIFSEPTAAKPTLGTPTLAGGNITITWTGGGTLEKSSTVTGDWTSTGDSDGSYTAPVGPGNEFFRVKQ
jgi:hypothetical protein